MKLRLVALVFLLMALFFSQVAAKSSRFIDNQNGTVLDTSSGLMWQSGDSHHDMNSGLNWYEAIEYVEEKNADKFAGHNDWRLPTMDELRGIWDARRSLKSKDGESIGLPPEFKAGGSYYLWSSDERSLDNAWYFGLGQKEDYFNLKDLGDLEQGVKMVRNTK